MGSRPCRLRPPWAGAEPGALATAKPAHTAADPTRTSSGGVEALTCELSFRFSQLIDAAKCLDRSVKKDKKKVLPSPPSKDKLRRGDGKFEAAFLDERALAIRGWLSQLLALAKPGAGGQPLLATEALAEALAPLAG